MTAPELQAFHLGIVVGDMQAAIGRYQAVLGVDLWSVRDANPNGLRFAYGRGAGQTWELIEVKGPGSSQFHQFRDRHGEGVQHIGFWTPDVRASLEQALAAGAELVTWTVDASGNAVVELLPGLSATEQHLSQLGMVTFVEGGLGGFRVEYIGRAGEDFLRDWLREDFARIVQPGPSWTGEPRGGA
jgi:catechol 2,3-dioxygenase-like lactoylglutathione lyase family enzyme